jgi:hypothetical protein
MNANSNELPETEETAGKPEPLRKFGQHVFGIAFHSDDWEKDIPLEYFQDEDENNPFGEGGNNG